MPERIKQELYFGIIEGKKVTGTSPEMVASAMLAKLPFGAMLSPMEFTVYPMSAGISVTAYVKDREWHYVQGVGA